MLMELIFKKYHKSERHSEKNYLIYDPARNPAQFTKTLFKAIANRNFGQNYENILIGPIMAEQKMTVRVLTPDGMEISANPGTQEIFRAYLHDQGYLDPAPFEDGCADNERAHGYAHIHAYGTVYYFPA